MPVLAVLLISLLFAGSETSLLRRVLDREYFQALSIRPDGNYLALVRCRNNPNGRLQSPLQLTIQDRAKNREWSHSLPASRYGYFRWSEANNEVAFLRWGNGFTEVWLLDLDQSSVTQILPTEQSYGVFEIAWWKDSADALQLMLLHSDGARTGYSIYDLRRREWVGETVWLGSFWGKAADLSPNQQSLAVTGIESPQTRAEGQPIDLYTYHLASEVLVKRTRGQGLAENPRFTPDSREVLCTFAPGFDLLSTEHREIALYPLEGEPRFLTKDLSVSIGDGIYGANERLWFSASGDEVLTVTQRGMSDHIVSIHLRDGTHRWLSDGAVSQKYLSVATAANLGVTIQSAPNQPEQVVLHDLTSAEKKVICEPNHELESAVDCECHPIAFEARDGLELEGLLILPPKSETPPPLIVALHDGSSGRHTVRFNASYAPILAEAGFALFLPNTRGSSGYDQRFSSANVGDFGGAEVEDIFAGVDAITESGRVDPNRLFLLGTSYGGYLAQVALTRTDRFRAAASLSGVSDWVEFYHSSDLAALAVAGLGGTPNDAAQSYELASPAFQTSKIQTPLLLVHGQRDLRVPFAQSETLHQRLLDQGTPTKLVPFRDEGHVFRRHDNIEAWIGAVCVWFFEHDHSNGH